MKFATEEDLLGALVLCPHCNQLLRVTEVLWRGQGMNPFIEQFGDYYIIRLSDGACTRMWADAP